MLTLGAFSAEAAASEAAGQRSRHIANLGRAGDSTADLLTRLDAEVLSESPELVVLLVGTNDLLNSKKAVSLETYRENLHALVKGIVAENIKLVLVTIPPAYAPYLSKRHGAEFYGAEGPGARITAGNEVIRRVARENNLPVVELFAALQQAGGASEHPACLIRNVSNSGSEDGVHPTAEGYRVIAALVADVIARENLQDLRRIVCFGDSITRGVHMTGEGTATGDTYPAFLARVLAERYPLSSPSAR